MIYECIYQKFDGISGFEEIGNVNGEAIPCGFSGGTCNSVFSETLWP